MKYIILLSAMFITGCATISLPPLPCRHIAEMQRRHAKDHGYDAHIQLFKRTHITATGMRVGYDYHAACYISHEGKAYWGSQKYPYTEFKRLKCPYGTRISEEQFKEMVGGK